MGIILNKVKTGLLHLTAPLFRLASYLVPKNQHVWVYIGWHNGPEGEIFADNSKYLFLVGKEHVANVTHVWLAKDQTLAKELQDQGYTAYYHRSLLGIWSALRAYYTIIDAYLQTEQWRFAGGSHVVQLLHGKGAKKKGYGKVIRGAYSHVFVPSEQVASFLPASFLQDATIHTTGYPRDDIFFQESLSSTQKNRH